jgi:ribosome-binding protein aMBF1 (putative translation factor)
MTIPDAIRAIRAGGMSIRRLAAELECALSTVQSYQAGRTEPRDEMAQRIRKLARRSKGGA